LPHSCNVTPDAGTSTTFSLLSGVIQFGWVNQNGAFGTEFFAGQLFFLSPYQQ